MLYIVDTNIFRWIEKKRRYIVCTFYCIHVCVLECVHVCVSGLQHVHCVYVCVWRPKIDILASINCSLFYFLRHSLSLNSELTDLVRLARWIVPGIPCISTPPPRKLQANWGPKLRFDSCIESTLMNEPLPQPRYTYLQESCLIRITILEWRFFKRTEC